MKTEYTVQCPVCGKKTDDANLPLHCTCGKPGLLRAEYGKNQLTAGAPEQGIYRFADWLPLSRSLQGSSAPVTYRSRALAGHLGLTSLFITFNGYWPEKGAFMTTGTFKECEAYSVCGRLPGNSGKTLVVASAGNTARAFAQVCSENKIPLIVVIPEKNLDALWFRKPLTESVKVVAAGKDADYFDAIELADAICRLDGYMPEGGAKNIARRDGMGTTVLSAAVEAGRIPDFYFQAVGSGTGAIAAWEANLRLLADGRFGKTKMKLMVSQNEPFILIKDSWKARTRELAVLDEDLARRQVAAIKATVLSNRRPPYGITGGLYDALSWSGGEVLSADNEALEQAGKLFLEKEGMDVTPEAGVALSSLMQAVKAGSIPEDAAVMLNVTGGGIKRLFKDETMYYKKADLIIEKNDISSDKLEKKLKTL